MKICPICGRPLNEGEVCSCQTGEPDPAAVPVGQPDIAESAAEQPVSAQAAPEQAEAAQTVQPEQSAAPQPEVAQAAQEAAQAPAQEPVQQAAQPDPNAQQPVGQYPPYPNAQPYQPQPKPDSKLVKAVRNLPVATKNYFKNYEKVIEIAKSKKDIVLPLLYVAILFFANLLLGIIFFSRMTDDSYYSGLDILAGAFGGVYFRFHFGFVLLGAVILTVFESAVCIGARFLTIKVFAKKATDQAFTEALIEYGFHCIPVIALTVVAAVFGLSTAWFLIPLLGFAAAYLIVMFVTDSLKSAESFENKLVRNIIIAGCVMVGFALVFRMMGLICSMNYSDSGMSMLNDLFSGFLN